MQLREDLPVKILVIGGTGKVGMPLVDRLLEHGVDVAVLVRSGERARLVRPPAKPVIGDILADPLACSSLFEGMDMVFMLNKASATEAVEGVMAVRLAREAGVRRFVYQTAHLLDELAYLPHLAPKVAVRKAVELSGMDYTFIAPNHFYQNDEMVLQALTEQHLYLTPLGPVGCWSVDVRDIAEAAAAALLTEGHAGRHTYNLVGPRAMTGEEAARCWADALGHPVRYAGGVDAWRDYMRAYLPAWLHYDLSAMYEDFDRRGMIGTEEDARQTATLIGHAPRTFEAFAAEQAERLRAASSVPLAPGRTHVDRRAGKPPR